MKKLIGILVAFLTVTLLTGCNISEALNNVEPTSWEKHEFEKSVRLAVRKAVQQPGIDNGSTLVVDTKGDTLIVARDSVTTRTVYLDIQSPAYPKGVSNKTLKVVAAIGIIATIGVILLLILVCVLIYTLRRQHNRNKSINNAIDHNYQLPEAFFTGTPAAPQVTINQFTQPTPVIFDENGQPRTGDTNTTTTDTDTVRNAINNVNKACGLMSSKDIRNGFALIGIGVMLFLAFASGHNAGVGFLCGGSLFVLGLAKFVPYFFNKRS